jgi:PEP-CTERM motif-containing protein
MKRALMMVVAGVGLMAGTSWGNPDTTLMVTAGMLQDSNSVVVATNSLAVLVVDTGGDGFESLELGASLTLGTAIEGNDVIVGKWEVGYASETAGELVDTTGPISYAGLGIAAGNAVRLYWFPSLGVADTVIGAPTPYGLYSDGVGVDGSAAWEMPVDTGATVDLKFLTETVGGSNPETAGRAAFVVPEPTTMLLVGAGLLGVAALRRRH